MLELLFFVPAAFLAGVLMFLAPCTLPIVPGYLAFIAGLPAGDMGRGSARGRIFRNALAFVLGFSIIFVLLGTFAGTLSQLLGPNQVLLSRVAGLVIILFGITMLGVLRLPFLSAEQRIRLPKFLVLGRPESSALIGVLFAVGWSPCIGPVLGTILLLASTSSTALQGALLLTIFSLGLGIPFLLSALFIERAGALFASWGRLTTTLSLVGGVVLILLGLLMVSGNMAALVVWGFGFFEGFGYGRLLEYL